MESSTILELFLLVGVSSSYTNMWWGNALRVAMHCNDLGIVINSLDVLTEEHIEVDVIRNKQGRLITFPTFRNGVIPKDGIYHLNVQGSNYMFVGWMQINADQIAWWGQNGGDDVMAGIAGGGTPLMSNYFPDVLGWTNTFHYLDKFDKGTPLTHILKKF